MDKDLLSQFRETISPAMSLTAGRCFRHKDTTAQALCPECEQLFCFSCMVFDAPREALLCEACHSALAQARTGKTWSRLARMPFIYVVLLVAVSLLAYSFEPAPSGKVDSPAAEKDRPWQLHPTGKLWLQQAARVKMREDYLAGQGAPRGEIAFWTELTHTALGNARNCWQGRKPELDLAIGEALTLARLGRTRSALDSLQGLEGDLSSRHSAYPAYLYHRGRLALSCNDREAGVRDWTAALTLPETATAAISPLSILEGLINMSPDAAQESALYLLIRQICGTFMTGYELRSLILAEVQTRNLADAFPRGLISSLKYEMVLEPGPDSVDLLQFFQLEGE